MSEIEGARGAFELWLRRENGKWADKITERHADGRYCTLQAYMDWGAFQAGWLAALTSIDPEAIRAEALADRDELKKRIAELEVALENLQFAESRYRYRHDTLGDGDIKTGLAWDSMKKRGDEARASLAEKE